MKLFRVLFAVVEWIDDRLLRIENKIIDALTVLMWWVEVNRDVSARALGSVFARWVIRVYAVYFAAVLPLQILEEQWALTGLSALLLVVSTLVGLLTMSESFWERYMLSYPTGTPNLGRYTVRGRRRWAFFFIFWGQMLVLADPGNSTYLIFLFGTCLDLAGNFLLSCDTLPPGERDRRRARNEAARQRFVPQLPPQGAA